MQQVSSYYSRLAIVSGLRASRALSDLGELGLEVRVLHTMRLVHQGEIVMQRRG